jgi:hypothetical protein
MLITSEPGWIAGHSVEVLLRVYAKCLDDGEDIANTRIDAALKAA